MTVEIIHGDSRDVIDLIASNSIDSVVTDPPYALVSITKRFGKDGATPNKFGKDGAYARASAGFMGQRWDTGETAFDPAFWFEVLRVLKPGGHVLAFGGTRTYHRLACAIEDAGFEIRDQIGWLYGSGFPKSHNQSGDWAGWGTALKPAWEPIVMARKPLDSTVAGNLAKWGVGAINIDGCRVGSETIVTIGTAKRGTTTFGDFAGMEPTSHNGRWPANIIHDGGDVVLAAFPAQGAAARFFYCAKASRSDRDDGLAAFEKKPLLWSSGAENPGSFQSAGTEKAARNPHPTVKPTELMRYLCRLITPPGGTVLDPFMGSGSTGRGAVMEGFHFTGIEMDPQYVQIARARVAAVNSDVLA